MFSTPDNLPNRPRDDVKPAPFKILFYFNFAYLSNIKA
jgi:hypothetical protein